MKGFIIYSKGRKVLIGSWSEVKEFSARKKAEFVKNGLTPVEALRKFNQTFEVVAM